MKFYLTETLLAYLSYISGRPAYVAGCFSQPGRHKSMTITLCAPLYVYAHANVRDASAVKIPHAGRKASSDASRQGALGPSSVLDSRVGQAPSGKKLRSWPFFFFLIFSKCVWRILCGVFYVKAKATLPSSQLGVQKRNSALPGVGRRSVLRLASGQSVCSSVIVFLLLALV